MRTAAHIAHATHASLSQHSIGSDSPVHSLVILGCLGQVVTGLSLSHPRRPRGSQSGREKWWDESFQVRVKEPLGTGSHQAISKNSSGCRLLIGHKKCFVLLCPIGKQFLLGSFREFVHVGYCLDHGLSGSCTKECTQSGNFQFVIKSPSDFKILSAQNLKTLFQKYKLELTTGIHACISHVLRKY